MHLHVNVPFLLLVCFLFVLHLQKWRHDLLALLLVEAGLEIVL